MAQHGEEGRALTIGIVFSFIGGILTLAVLSTISPWLADLALEFGPYEYSAIAPFSLTLVAGLSSSFYAGSSRQRCVSQLTLLACKNSGALAFGDGSQANGRGCGHAVIIPRSICS